MFDFKGSFNEANVVEHLTRFGKAVCEGNEKPNLFANTFAYTMGVWGTSVT